MPVKAKISNPNLPKKNVTSSSPIVLLFPIIQSLLINKSTEEQERLRVQFENAARRSQERLQGLVASHHSDLDVILKIFTGVPQRVTHVVQMLGVVKHRIKSCRELLSRRRKDKELKTLWSEALEHRHALQLLTSVEGLRAATETRCGGYLASGHYLHATQLLLEASTTLKGPLIAVAGLSDIRQKVTILYKNAYDGLLRDITRHIYKESSKNILKIIQNHGQGSRLNVFDENGAKLELVESFYEEDILVNPEDDSHSFIALMIYCLFLLGKISKGIDYLLTNVGKECAAILWQTPSLMHKVLSNLNMAKDPKEKILKGFLYLVFEQFKSILALHQWVKLVVKNLAKKRKETLTYDLSLVWLRAQEVLETMVGEYLNLQNDRGDSLSSRIDLDINSYFTKKRTPKTSSLFKFENSSHALSITEYNREVREALEREGGCWEMAEHSYVVDPSPYNIVILFNSTMDFLGDTTTWLLMPLMESSLNTFLVFCVKNFLQRVTTHTDSIAQNTAKSFDNCKCNYDAKTQKSLGTNRPLLESAVLMEQHLKELEDLLSSLSVYALKFYRQICTILQAYKDACYNSFNIIFEHEHRTSYIWSKNKDIVHLIKSLPLWYLPKDATDFDKKGEGIVVKTEYINKKIADKLIFNLSGKTFINHQDVMLDIHQIRILCHFQHSMEWFGSRIQKLITELPSSPKLNRTSSRFKNVAPLSSVNMGALRDFVSHFQSLSEQAMLVLYLELRAHCFYFLLPVATQGNYCLSKNIREADPEVTRLIKHMDGVDAAMRASLDPDLRRVVLCGLEHVPAAIFTNSVGVLKRINSNGVQKMCRNIWELQLMLSDMGGDQSGSEPLARARQYVELLNKSSEEVLVYVAARKGPEFRELEYINVLQLLHRSSVTAYDPQRVSQDLTLLLKLMKKPH